MEKGTLIERFRDDACDECGKPLGDAPIRDDEDMTQFCSEDCEAAFHAA
jgi:hypothetical protein